MLFQYGIIVGSKEEAADICYRFLTCALLRKREVGIFNRDSKMEPSDGYMFPLDIFSGKFTDEDLPGYETFRDRIAGDDWPAIHCVAAADALDVKRVNMIVMPRQEGGYIAAMKGGEGGEQKLTDRIAKRLGLGKMEV